MIDDRWKTRLDSEMKSKTSLVTLALWLAVGTACFGATNPMMGTWKLNEAKSHIAPGSPKNTTVVYKTSFFKTKVIVNGVDGKGKPTHNEWTGNLDGKDYAVTGDPNADTRAVMKVDDHHYKLTGKKGGKVTLTGKIVVSADGKNRTLTTTSTNAKGKTVRNVAFYIKQ